LVLGNNKIGSASAEAIAQSPHIGNLRVLCLTGMPLGDRDLLALAQSTTLGKLEKLQMDKKQCTETAIAAFLASPLGARCQLLLY
jgi:hypothetical protein